MDSREPTVIPNGSFSLSSHIIAGPGIFLVHDIEGSSGSSPFFQQLPLLRVGQAAVHSREPQAAETLVNVRIINEGESINLEDSQKPGE